MASTRDTGTLGGMSAARQSGGGVGAFANGFPTGSVLYRIAVICALLLALLVGSVAHAGRLYRCTGSAGEVVYSNSRSGYSGCHVVGSYDGARPAAAAHARSTLAAPRAAPVSFGAVSSTAHSTAQLLDSLTPARATSAPLELFTDVSASVETTASRLPLSSPSTPAARSGEPGQWRYSESHSAQTQSLVAAPAPAPGGQVLRGAVYRVTAGDGSVEYTNVRPSGHGNRVVKQLFTYLATCMACNLHSPIRWGSVRLNLDAYAQSIRAASAQFGVDEALLRAIIHAESAFNPRALSIKGAQGLMQLMPGTASDMGVADAFNTDENIRGGARYLAQLLQTFDGNRQLAAAAYNAGPGAVTRYRGVPPYAETKVYVQRVSTLFTRYSQAIHPPLARVGGEQAPR